LLLVPYLCIFGEDKKYRIIITMHNILQHKNSTHTLIYEMNYNLGETVTAQRFSSVGRKLKYDEGALMDKFEETVYNEGGYVNNSVTDDFIRGAIADWGADEPQFESDAPRRNTASAGKLNMLHEGHRGTADQPWSSETFLGDLSVDPRGTRDEVDMAQMREQRDARARFQKPSIDTANEYAVTSGERPRGKIMADIVEGNKQVARRLKTFHTQMDGMAVSKRSPGTKYTTHAHAHIDDYVSERSRVGEAILKSVSMQGNSSSLFKGHNHAAIIQNKEWFRNHTGDTDLAIMKYGLSAPKHIKKHSGPSQRGAEADSGRDISKLGQVKNIGVVMAALIKGRDAMTEDADRIEQNQDVKARAMRSAIVESLSVANYERDGRFSNSTMSEDKRTHGVTVANTLSARDTKLDGEKTAQYAELMYKSVQPGADHAKIWGDTTHDLKNAPKLAEDTRIYKRGLLVSKETGVAQHDSEVVIEGSSLSSFNYKSGIKRAKLLGKNGEFNYEKFAGKSLDSHVRSVRGDVEYGVGSKQTDVKQIRVHDYTDINRSTGAIGVKGTARRFTEGEKFEGYIE
jgi:hypothetical protein